MEASISIETPTKDAHGMHMTDSEMHNWITFMLKEQCEILQLLLLYYKVIEPTITDVQRMLRLFQNHGFGYRQPFQIITTEGIQSLIDQIGYLESFVIVQCFELDLMFKYKESRMLFEHYLLKDEKAVEKLCELVLTLGSHQIHSPILLAWLLVAQWSEMPEMKAHCGKLGRIALHLGVFEYLVSALASPIFSGREVVPDIANNIVYSLLSAVLTEFDLPALGCLQSLFDITQKVLQYPSIANDFWMKDDISGIRVLVNECIDMFPLEFCQLLTICTSLSSASLSSCSKVVEQIKYLPVYTEYLDKVDSTDLVMNIEPDMYQLKNDRLVYGDNSVVIPKGTFGHVSKPSDKNDSSIIQWKVRVNGWQVCLREIYRNLQEMSFVTHSTPMESISQVVVIGKLVNTLLKANIDLRFELSHITDVLFSVFQRFINYSTQPKDIVMICLKIAATLSKDGVSDIWQQLVKINFLPHLVKTDVSSQELIRLNVNAGIVGHLIASSECVSGDYGICLAFLDLLSNVSMTLVEDDVFLACEIYVLREIFSYFHKWFYNDPQERILIGQKCLDLLHNLFAMHRSNTKTLKKAQELCIYHLLHLEAGLTLLKIVCTGEDVIQQTILKQNSNFGNQIAKMIRLSLSVLNRLLLLRKSATLSSSPQMTPLEAVLFSVPGQSNQLPVVLMVAHYAFQQHNPQLATLAVQLLKRFAKEFPMSLLACFGSEAEAIRYHFLERLGSPYEDTRLRASIFELLTMCVMYQPGLIEMFINVKKKDKVEIKEEDSKSCLDCVKTILKEKRAEKNNTYPRDLLYTSVEFIHGLWAGHQGLAMEALKADTQFWALLCCSLLSDDFSQEDPGITAFVLRTLALEVFYSGKNNLSEHIKAVFNEMYKNGLLIKWSKHIHLSLGDFGTGDISSSKMDISVVDPQDSFALLTSWRDFLLITAANEPIEVSADHKEEILKHILDHLMKRLTSNSSRELILLSELFLMLSRHWKREVISILNAEGTRNLIYDIFTIVTSHAENIHLRVQLAVVSLSMFVVRLSSESELEISNLKDWLTPCCQLLKKASLLIQRSVECESSNGILKLPVYVVSLLNKLVQENNDWLPILKSHSIISFLVSILTYSLKMNIGSELPHGILTLFITMVNDRKAAEALCNAGFMPEMTLLLSQIDLKLQIMDKRRSLMLQKAKVSQLDVYFAYLQFLTILLKTLGNYVLKDCWDFLGVHQQLIHLSLLSVGSCLTNNSIHNAVLSASFLLQLSSHLHAWKLEHPSLLNALLIDVSHCVYNTIAILYNPERLNQSLPNSIQKPQKSIKTNESSPKTLMSIDESEPSKEVCQIQEKLFELLAVSLTILSKNSPEMCEAMLSHHLDSTQPLLLQINFSLPSPDRDGPLSFGTILVCVNLCLKLLAKHEKVPSPRKTPETLPDTNRYHLMYILETSLALLLSQSTIALTHPEFSSRDKQFLCRELAAELDSVNFTVHRHLLRKTPHSSTNGTFGVTPPTELPFLKMISNLIDKLFK